MLALALMVSGAACAHAQNETPFAPFESFQGCWRGAFEGQPGVTDERCLTPMLGGRYLRDTHVVRGGPEPYSGESIYAYDVEARRVSYTYYAADGGISRGYGEAAADGLNFPADRYVGADGNILIMRSHWVRRGPDAYDAVTEIQRDGVWQSMMRISYQRALDLSPPQ